MQRNYSWWERFKADSMLSATPYPGSEADLANRRGIKGSPGEVYAGIRRHAEPEPSEAARQATERFMRSVFPLTGAARPPDSPLGFDPAQIGEGIADSIKQAMRQAFPLTSLPADPLAGVQRYAEAGRPDPLAGVQRYAEAGRPDPLAGLDPARIGQGIGDSAARILALAGDEESRRALELSARVGSAGDEFASKLRGIDLGGQITIRIDSPNAPARVTALRSNDPAMRIDVTSGQSMVLPQ
jgi:hypothetical protein